MKRKPTAEQKEAAAIRRKAIQTLAQKIKAMGETERIMFAARCPIVSVKGAELSVFNQCMIAMQMPTASIVGGFNQWREDGRKVCKGQKALAIWIPSIKENQETGDEEKFFFIGNVFDISQTEEIDAVPVPEFPEVRIPLFEETPAIVPLVAKSESMELELALF